MDLLVACGFCGDPSADTLVLQAVVAATIATPWYFRDRVLGTLRAAGRRLRGAPDPAASCPLPESDEASPEPPA